MKSGKTGALRAKSLFTAKKSPVTACTNGLYSHQDKKNYQNQYKQLTVTRTKWEKNQKEEQKAKLQTGSRNNV